MCDYYEAENSEERIPAEEPASETPLEDGLKCVYSDFKMR